MAGGGGVGQRVGSRHLGRGRRDVLAEPAGLEGLGRFYGLRYVALEPSIEAMRGLRMALGFDLTLLLAIVNVAVLAWLLVTLTQELERGSVRLPQRTP